VKKKITEKKGLRGIGTVLFRAILSFIVVFVIGIMGMAHYRSVRKSTSNKSNPASSGNLIESFRIERAPAHQVLKVEGVQFDISRKYIAGLMLNIKSQLAERKKGLGWREIQISDKRTPLKNLNLTHSSDAFQYFLSPKNRISGYLFVQMNHTVKVTEVSFDVNAVAKRLKKQGVVSGIIPRVDVPDKYRTIMPDSPVISLESSSSESSGIYVCSIANSKIAEVASQIRDRLHLNAWKEEQWSDIAEYKAVFYDKKMIVARKDRILCNIILSKDENSHEIIASYRFSNMRQAELGR